MPNGLNTKCDFPVPLDLWPGRASASGFFFFFKFWYAFKQFLVSFLQEFTLLFTLLELSRYQSKHNIQSVWPHSRLFLTVHAKILILEYQKNLSLGTLLRSHLVQFLQLIKYLQVWAKYVLYWNWLEC